MPLRPGGFFFFLLIGILNTAGPQSGAKVLCLFPQVSMSLTCFDHQKSTEKQ